MPLYGNPGDYAWGRGGLDTIVTQLMNQMEGSGPPPMEKTDIEKIPSVKISQEQVGMNVNMSRGYNHRAKCKVCEVMEGTWWVNSIRRIYPYLSLLAVGGMLKMCIF